MSSDECRRRGRRTGAAAGTVAAVQRAACAADRRRAPTPPLFPSVCRLVEKYTMLIERHRQKQNGLMPPARGKPVDDGSSDRSESVGPSDRSESVGPSDRSESVGPSDCSESVGASGPASNDDAAAWNRPPTDDNDGCEDDDDEPSDDAEHYHRRWQRRDDDVRRLSCESLVNVLHGSDEDDKLMMNSNGEKARTGNDRRAQLQVVSRLEVNRTKTKRKRRKSWTGPVGRQGPGNGGPSRKGHSLDQGYETTHHQDFAARLHHHTTLFRSFSSNADGESGTVVVDGSSGLPGGRQFRTPSVVVSDHSEDPVSFSSMFTLDDLDELEPRPDCGFNDSSSDCSAASTWSAAGSVISVLDSEYSLHTPERKISGCSTCSTFSGEDVEDEAYRLSKLKPKDKKRQKKVSDEHLLKHLLVSLLENSPRLISGKFCADFTYDDSIKKWKSIISELESCSSGPKGKSVDDWKRTWSDLKRNVKDKASKIRFHYRATGGGEASKEKLTDLEERIVGIIGENMIEGHKRVHEFGVSTAKKKVFNTPKQPTEEVHTEMQSDISNSEDLDAAIDYENEKNIQNNDSHNKDINDFNIINVRDVSEPSRFNESVSYNNEVQLGSDKQTENVMIINFPEMNQQEIRSRKNVKQSKNQTEIDYSMYMEQMLQIETRKTVALETIAVTTSKILEAVEALNKDKL